MTYILFFITLTPGDVSEPDATQRRKRRQRDESISEADVHVPHTVTIDVHVDGVDESTDL